VALATAVVLLLLAAVVWALNRRDEAPITNAPGAFQPSAEQLRRGAELARAGNCIGCHTARGGLAYAGGRAIDTPFGRVFASNLTPDDTHGLGRWSADHFWRALHNGRSRDGRLLYPAFPYPNFTLVTRADSDALYAYLRSLAPVPQANRPHELRFPYNLQASLAVWRALYFSPRVYQPEAAQTAEWNRGSYLVRGLGHCNACHASRNRLGATNSDLELGGGLIPMQGWYAPSLASAQEAGVAAWRPQDVVQLLKTGVSAHGSVMGPMAEVVYRSTQYLPDADLRAMAVYLQALPQHEPRRPAPEPVDPAQMALGGRLYKDHCASCHGDQGQGAAGAYPPLAGNRGVTLESPANVLRAIVSGGFPPTTAGNPRPYGMPPFGASLNDAEIAAVATYIRRSWGHDAPAVLPLQVLHIR
jgi:mono/diheme cytochrome c family protein